MVGAVSYFANPLLPLTSVEFVCEVVSVSESQLYKVVGGWVHRE